MVSADWDSIMDAWQITRLKGSLADATHSAFGECPQCGDKIKIDLKIKDNRILEAKHESHGCVLSCGVAALLCLDSIGELAEPVEFEPDFEVTPMRQKCIALAVETFNNAIMQKHENS